MQPAQQLEQEKKHLDAIRDAADHLAKLLPTSGSGLNWSDVVDDNDLLGRWAPNPDDLQGSVLALLLDTYRRGGAAAVVPLIESASRLADHRHRRGHGDERFLLAQLEVYVRLLGVDHSEVMSEIAWREYGPAMAGESPDAVRVARCDLVPLRKMFEVLRLMQNRQAAGLLLEQRLLWRLFDLYCLEPAESFKVVGQQIDGSFKHRGAIYLLEAKWTAEKVGARDIQFFDHKVKTKSPQTRGLMLSVAGYSDEALVECRTSNLPRTLLIDGGHLARLLAGDERLDEMLSRLSDHFDRTGEPYLPVG